MHCMHARTHAFCQQEERLGLLNGRVFCFLRVGSRWTSTAGNNSSRMGVFLKMLLSFSFSFPFPFFFFFFLQQTPLSLSFKQTTFPFLTFLFPFFLFPFSSSSPFAFLLSLSPVHFGSFVFRLLLVRRLCFHNEKHTYIPSLSLSLLCISLRIMLRCWSSLL